MKKVIIAVLITLSSIQSFGQDVNVEKSLALARDFMRKVYDLEPFDSLIKVTTLSKDVPNAGAKCSLGYFQIVMLELQTQKYPYSDLSYLPYLYLPQNQRNLVYERLIDGVPEGIDLSTIYAVMSKANVVTYLDIKNGKVRGIRAAFNHGGTYYLHEFSMDHMDKEISSERSESKNGWTTSQNLVRNDRDGLLTVQNFTKFVYDSLSIGDFGRLGKMLNFDTLDYYAVYFTLENLKERITKFPYPKLEIVPYSKLSKKTKRNLVINDERTNEIFTVKRKKEILTFVYLSDYKVKYFLTLKNLKGQYVFVPYTVASQTVKIK